MNSTHPDAHLPTTLPIPESTLLPCPTLMTEEELIRFLRIPEISNAANHRHVIENLKRVHGERFIQFCFDRRLSAGTATKKIKHLKRVFQLAEDRGQLDRHPLRKLKPPKVAKRKVRVFTDQECYNLCTAARKYEERGRSVRWELLIRMGLSTGIRRGELMNTTWRDIDFANMTVEVFPKKNSADTWEWHIKDTDHRTLPLTADLVKLLVGHQAAPMINVVMIAVYAVMCGAADFVAIAEFGRKTREWPARFLDLKKGIPSHDRFNARIKNKRLTAIWDETYLEEVLVGN